ncbi:MAG: hypothetical protein EXR30_03970 [Betaproteobacteria bacterium]|nr:hypothetical protein [Betaproteobacteria bacterium]MSQ87752.1 hypothetical protein [Betaproteobacteria bacterium]
MTSPVDPNDVLMTGENSFIRFSPDGGKTQTDRVSHWRVLWCPVGAGHALFMQSTLSDGAVRIWSDNVPVVRWLQQEIESLLFPPFADAKTLVEPAAFIRSGGIDTRAAELVTAKDAEVLLSWEDFIAPFVLNMPPGSAGRPIGVFSTFFPARAARITLNGRVATGTPWMEKRGARDSTSACLAWSETWVKPR